MSPYVRGQKGTSLRRLLDVPVPTGMSDIFLENITDSLEAFYLGVFEAANYESNVRFLKFKMADSLKTFYSRVFENAYYKSDVTFPAFKNTDIIWNFMIVKSKILLQIAL